MSESTRNNKSSFLEETPWTIRKQILDYNATDCMSDVERAIYFGLPKGCRMRERAKIISPDKLKIGENCWIGEGAILDASGYLEIGENVSVGLNVYLWTHNSFKLNIRGKNTREHSKDIKRMTTKIGNNCFIGGPSVIMPGVTIGDKCVISPMSVVYDDLPDKTIFKPYREFFEMKKENESLKQDLSLLKSNLNELQEKIGWLTKRYT